MNVGLIFLAGIILAAVFGSAGLLAGASVLPNRTVADPRKPPYKFLRITMHGRCLDSGYGNGLTVYKNLQIIFDYGPQGGVCNGNSNAEGQKFSLVNTATTGFQAVVATPLITTCFAASVVGPPKVGGWINNGIFARWLDTPSDMDIQVGAAGNGVVPAGGYLGPTGDGGVTGPRLPLDQAVTVRKYTGTRGRSWMGHSWHFPCVPTSFFVGDEMSAAGITAWSALKAALYASISDGTSTLYPITVSVKNSQLITNPTVVGWLPLILPGTDPVRGVTNPLIDYTIGIVKRRKEKSGLTF